MIVAFACWDNHIAPVFDTVRQIYLIETDSEKIVAERQEVMFGNAPLKNVARLTELKVETLICGAISRPVQEMVSAQGIHVIPFVAGKLFDVVHAWRAGEINTDLYAMPGCCERGMGRGFGRGMGGRGIGRGGKERGAADEGNGFGIGNGMGRGRNRGNI